MMQVRFFPILILLVLVLTPATAVVGGLEVLSLKNKKTFYLYNDAKTTLRFTDIPGNADLIQAHISNPGTEGATARLVGKRSQEIQSDRTADFVVQIVPDRDGRPQRKSILLGLKTFAKKSGEDGYDITGNYTNFIRIKECPRQGEPVCTIVKVRCREGSEACINGKREVYKEFESECDAQKSGAAIHSYGACQQ